MTYTSLHKQEPITKTAQLSPDQVRTVLDAQGLTISAFCRAHNLNPNHVYQLLSGHKKGRTGEVHRAAVLLGLKKGLYPPAPEIQAALTNLHND